MNLQEGATAKDRNEQIGGHKSIENKYSVSMEEDYEGSVQS